MTIPKLVTLNNVHDNNRDNRNDNTTITVAAILMKIAIARTTRSTRMIMRMRVKTTIQDKQENSECNQGVPLMHKNT